MEVNKRPRKACDLCYSRKLKCDRTSPRCSNCVTYGKDCTHAAQSRKWKKPGAQRSECGRESDVTRLKSLEDEVERLRAELRQERNRVRDAPHNVNDGRVGSPAAESANNDNEDDTSTGSTALPPLQEAMTMIAVFLNSLNSVLPLFDDETLLRLVGECYALPPRQRDPTAWAAIHVILALAWQHMPGTDATDNSSVRIDRATEYLNKAQSITSQLMLGEIRLLNIQVLLGMVMVLQTASDATAALILISATMRLVYKLGLQNRSSSAYLDLTERRQRDRVFWLAYILDKSLSLRANQPSVQLDDDIDVDLPSSSPDFDGDEGGSGGTVVSTNGKARMNFLLARVQLANIEGGVYDCLYSTRAANRSREERSVARQSIVKALEDWHASIPPEFRAAAVSANTRNNPACSSLFCVMHSTSLQCITLVNHANAWDQQWITGLQNYSRGFQALELPSGWQNLVGQARGYMILFREAWSSDAWFKKMVSCSYITAMGLLIANDLSYLEHDQMQQDSHLADMALEWLGDRVSEGQKPDVHALLDVCAEAVRVVRQRRAEAIAAKPAGNPLSNFLIDTWSFPV